MTTYQSMHTDCLKLSVVTVFKLGKLETVETLERTIISVQHQSIQPHEHILIVSGVEDESPFMAYRNAERISLLINIDNSIYNAMNIGLRLATGNSVLFLNGGDEFFDSNSIKKIQKLYRQGNCIAFRTAQIYDGDIYVRPSLKRMKEFHIGPPHQAFVAPLPFAKGVKFDETKRITADRKWMLEVMGGTKTTLSEEILSKFYLGGISNFPSLRKIKIYYQEKSSKCVLIETIKLIIMLTLGPKKYYKILLSYKSDSLPPPAN